MAWNKNVPSLSEAVSGSTERIRQNWEAIQEWMDVEHEGLTSSTPGVHRPGVTGFITYTASSNLSAAVTSGALAYTTDTGEFLITDANGNWVSITGTYWSRMRRLGDSANLVLPSSTWTKLSVVATPPTTYDSLSEYASGNSRWIAKESGHYLVMGTIRYPATTHDYQKAVAIYQNGSAVSIGNLYGSSVRSVAVYDILSIEAGDYIELYGWHNHTTPVTAVGAGLTIHRVSG